MGTRSQILLAFLAPLCGGGEELPDTLEACLHLAAQADAASDLDRWREILDHAETLEGRPQDVAFVQRKLAVLDWKFDLRDSAARERLERATEGAEPGMAWLQLARLEDLRGDHEAQLAAARAAERVGAMTEVRRAGRLEAAEAVVDGAAARRRAGESVPELDLRAAHATLLEAVEAEPGLLEPSQLLVEASVLLEDGESALVAWSSYYHLRPGDPAPSGIVEGARAVESFLPRLGAADFDADDRVALIGGLRATFFHGAAELLALDPELPRSHRDADAVVEALAYADFARTLREEVDEYYRRCMLGRPASSQLDAIVRRNVRALHGAIDAPGSKPRSVSRCLAWLEDRFGVHGSVGRTAGTYDLHLGHAVVDETRPVEQYGHAADLRFVAVDHMLSNGFQSWAWEYGAEHGGWAEADVIWQVRSSYADAAIQIWRQVHDPDALERYLADAERESALDEERAAAEAVCFLPGLASRLRWQDCQAMLAGLDRRGLEGPERRLAFIRELGIASIEASVFSHEGRHAIDKRLGEFDTPTMEFRAKLAEVAFAHRPRLEVANLISPGIGGRTPHGQANQWALQGLVDWVEARPSEVDGFDPTRPTLVQVDLLTDAQLRAAFRSMDPLADAPAGPGSGR